MGYAEVSVNSPAARSGSFSYAIPPDMKVTVGQAVWVPFGQKTLQGVVVDLTAQPSVEETKSVSGIIDPVPVLSPAKVTLAKWISEYYRSSLFNAISLILPPGFERRALTFYSRTAKEYDTASLPPESIKLMELVGQDRVNQKDLEKILGKKRAQKAAAYLVNHGILERSYSLEKDRVKTKIVTYLKLSLPAAEVVEKCRQLRERRSVKQAETLEFLAAAGQPVALSEVRAVVPVSTTIINTLVEKGYIAKLEIPVRRQTVTYETHQIKLPPVLTAAQETAMREIKASMLRQSSEIFLLHGVTGSGKTEVYLRALAETVRLGKKGIMLVPEISLTPQTIERFAARFPQRVAILHSRLSLGEQFDEWQRIRDGECDVVIGPRSALFAPLPDPGLIILDEEHEWTYKQTENSPRYHARDVALKLAELTQATVILGSATPSVETYYYLKRGDYRLLSLPEKVTPDEGSPLPEVEVVDLKQELMSGNRSIFSRSLEQSITEAVGKKEQVMLFLNRRGGAAFVQCRKCGFVIRCKRCDVSLTYHSDEEKLVCHQCNYRMAVPVICPRCTSRSIKFVGIGTQKVEEEASKTFPFARTMRWDSDVTRRQTHEEILRKFRDHEADILVGTQMIAKGLDIPLVTLVGVINADVSLNLPDFRAGERTFQLLCQVAGRAGRGPAGGKVIVQTYEPENDAIRAAAQYDYVAFYEQEITRRRELNNPPFTHLVRLVYTHSNENRCIEEAERLAKTIRAERDARGIADLSINGPAPAFIQKLRSRYRWQLILRSTLPTDILSHITLGQGWTVDVDPVGI